MVEVAIIRKGNEAFRGQTARLGNGINHAEVVLIGVSFPYLASTVLCFMGARMADQDAKDEAAKKRIITHMNEDHRDSVCIY